MFSHIFLYRLKILLRDRTLVFWTLVFPFMMSTLFHLVFAGFSRPAHFSPIALAVVDNEAYRSAPFFRQALSAVSTGESRMLDLVESPDESHAKNLLKEEKIKGYILVDDPIQWHVAQSGLSQSMVKAFLDQYSQVVQAVQTILNQTPAALADVIGQLEQSQEILKQDQVSQVEADIVLIIYYALLALSCMYGAFYGLSLVLDVQGNLSARAARVNMAPMYKLNMFMAGLLASFTVHITGLLAFLVYLHWLLGVDFGGQGLAVLAATILGSLTGLTFGAFVGVAVRGKENVKVASISSITLLGAFLAGMMAPQVKFHIASSMPLLSRINPVNLLADAFYALYYYDDYLRYGQNMGMLFLFTVLFCAGVYTLIRRRQYVSL